MHLLRKMSVFGLLLAGPSRDLVPSAQKQTSIFSDIKGTHYVIFQPHCRYNSYALYI